MQPEASVGSLVGAEGGQRYPAGPRLWIPVATMLFVSLISYVDRNTLAVLAPTILRETGLSAEQYGLVISAFSLAYMVANPLWGRLLDRWGLRWGMYAAVSVWTAASAAHAFMRGFWGFAVARAFLGFGEGATFPGGLRAAMQTLPVHLRSRGIAVAYSGGSLGAVLTPLIVTPIALAWGWRAAFLFTGVIGVTWLGVWSVVSRRPDVRQRPPKPATPAGPVGPRWLDRHIWSFAILYALGALPIAFVLYGAAIYLHEALGASQRLIGALLWIPPLGWEAGYFFWGWMADRAARRHADRSAQLRRLMAVLAALALPLGIVPWAGHLGLAMVLLWVAMFDAAGFIILSLAYATDVYTARHAGFISGVGSGAWSAAVAIIMPVFGHLFDGRQWELAFLLAGAAPVMGWACWRAMNW